MESKLDEVRRCIATKHEMSRIITRILYDSTTTQEEKQEIYKLIAQDKWE